ncbi:MAG TPA: M28 family peptidase [Oscillatoriaceae cyanobacterium M33_DOE_052]|uniref:M28 family peptidase n=1 Tax=Planktothricoides sp. SpSt-374 TaxID=2282167 RepID=A0A7C3VFY2_9CYAN|nr:M28 family peptidase [Oscillatoriaceae cyanobacterium M33_DOE_052]
MIIDENLKNNLQSHLFQIVRERDPYLATGGYFYVREYIRSELQKWGIVETHKFLDNGKTHQNLILNLPGDDSSRPPILIGAHYDTVPGSPGADDNGTGIVVLLELARIFATSPAKYPLRLVAFDLEEYGLLGSTAYAKHLHANQEPLRLMISLEMLGYRDSTPNSQSYPIGLQYFYPNTGDFIALIGNLSNLIDLKKISHSIKTTANIPSEILPVPMRGFIVPDTRRSDHAPFWDQGYAAIMITDTANMRNPHYHQPTDTIDTLDLDFLTGVCQGLAAAIHNL